jgi:D-alanyl-D-alanine carboxypeptidase
MLYNAFMSEKEKKSFRIKIYIILLLILLILAVLFYLVFSGAIDKLRPHPESGVPVPCEPTIEPTDEPQHTADPSDTSDPDNSEDPSGSQSPAESSEPAESTEPSSSETPETAPAETQTPEPTYNPADDDIDSLKSVTRIVSPSRKIDASYVPDHLRKPDIPAIDDANQNLLRDDAATALEKMNAAAKKAGFELYLVSGYRSYEFQQKLYDYWVKQKGKAYADELDSHPGGSEHQLGLACNLGTVDKNCELKACFADTEAYQWLLDHSWEYGFIERYPKDKQNITGITYSPWNFRYVGTDAAKRIYESGLTMEEYYGLE